MMSVLPVNLISRSQASAWERHFPPKLCLGTTGDYGQAPENIYDFFCRAGARQTNGGFRAADHEPGALSKPGKGW